MDFAEKYLVAKDSIVKNRISLMKKMREFVHLHNHTHFSLLDSITEPKQLIEAAISDGQRAIALTDHGVMFGCFQFYKLANKLGIKPILGMEAYVANGSRHERISGKSKDRKEKNYFHLVLLAKDLQGYKNLMRLTTLAHTEGFYYKPRIDRVLLEKYHDGLIATGACMAGEINHHLIYNEIDKAREAAMFYKDLFGDDFYIELQNHNLKEDKFILARAPRLAKELEIKTVCTNDVHYLQKDHAVAHNVYLLIKDVKGIDENVNINDLRYRTPEMYFKTQEEMNILFEDYPEAIDSTIEIAEKCDLHLESKLFMPEFPIPETSTANNLEEYLEELTFKGLKKKYKEITEEIEARARMELAVINNMKFPGYFLIVWDFIRAARQLGVRVGPGRGSAAGSIVAYALDITNVDPLPFDLLFERFLNPERISMPDIDIDFNDEKRDIIINYVKNKYGEDAVAMIITFNKLSTKAVLKDVGRVLGIHHSEINNITKKIPTVLGKVTPLIDAIELPDLQYLKESKDKKLQDLIKYSLLLENKNRNPGTHAAGVIIAPNDIVNYVPLYQNTKSKEQSIEVATQYTMEEVEGSGLLKMDFLGLQTLSIIDHTLEAIKQNYDKEIDIDAIDFNDEKTYQLFSEGRTLSVFQFESGKMQEYLRQLKPQNLEEITAMNALYRPGPMDNIPEYIDRKHGKKPIEYLHPIMEKALKSTYGIIVYQEQVMQLARDIGGFSLGGADILRRAMGKKKTSVMEEQKPIFLEGAKKKGIDKDTAEEIFQLIEKFAKYGFNKSHSLAYSYLAFQTAWLKTHYTGEFLSANMSAEINDQAKIVALIEEAKTFGFSVVHPDVNRSMGQFNAKDDKIFFGLTGIKNVGAPAVNSIIEARKEKPFTSFFDFAARVDTKLVNRKTFEALICVGAFDSLHPGQRAALYDAIDSALVYARAILQNDKVQMDSLFGETAASELAEPDFRDVEPWTDMMKLEREKEFLNFYISGHPLMNYAPFVNSFSTFKISKFPKELSGSKVVLCGMIDNISQKYDKKNKSFAIADFEDFDGRCELKFWSDTYAKFGYLLENDAVLFVEGTAILDGEKLSISVSNVLTPDDATKLLAEGYHIWISINGDDVSQSIDALFRLCTSPESNSTIMFHIRDKKNDILKDYIAYDVNIDLSEKTVKAIVEIFGRNYVRFIKKV